MGRETSMGLSMGLLTGKVFYMYEGPRDHQKPSEEEFVLPI